MKTTESKTTTQVQTKKEDNRPFFSQEGQDGGVFTSERPFFAAGEPTAGHFFNPGSAAIGLSTATQTPPIQAKLTIGAPDDPYEREADAMAEKVVQRLAAQPNQDTSAGAGDTVSPSSTGLQRKCAECEQEEKMLEKEDLSATDEQLQRKPIFDSNAEPPDDQGGDIQRKPENKVTASKGKVSFDEAENAIDALKELNKYLIEEIYEWIFNNYNWYFAATQTALGTSMLSLAGNSTKGEFLENVIAKIINKDLIAKNIEKSLASALQKQSIKIAVQTTSKGLILILTVEGTLIAPVVGTAIGFVVGVILDSAISFVVNLMDDDQAIISRIEGALTHASIVENLRPVIKNIRKNEQAKIEDEYTNKKSEIRSIKNQNAVDSLTASCNEGVKAIKKQLKTFDFNKDHSLYLHLLRTWVMENAGDDDSPAKGIKSEEWEKVIAEIRKEDKNFSEDDDQITNHPELFAFQFRSQLRRWGIKTKDADRLITELQSRNLTNLSEPIANEYNKKIYDFNHEDIESYEKFFARLPRWPWVTDNQRDIIKQGNFMFYFTLYLDEDDGTVFVDMFYHRLKLFDVAFYEDSELVGVESPDN